MTRVSISKHRVQNIGLQHDKAKRTALLRPLSTCLSGARLRFTSKIVAYCGRWAERTLALLAVVVLVEDLEQVIERVLERVVLTVQPARLCRTHFLHTPVSRRGRRLVVPTPPDLSVGCWTSSISLPPTRTRMEVTISLGYPNHLRVTLPT